MYFNGLLVHKDRWARCVSLTTVFAGALLIVNLFYGFDEFGLKLGEYHFKSKLFSQINSAQLQKSEKTLDWLKQLRVPVSKHYLYGMDEQQVDFEAKQPSYLRGEWRRGGWLYYYLYAAFVKSTIPMLVSCVAGAGWLLMRICRRENIRAGSLLLLPAIAIIGCASIKTGLNHHYRYVLPSIPFLVICGAGMCAELRSLYKPSQWVAGILIVWHIVQCLAITPNQLSYFNEMVGGPTYGECHLVDSNIDWGQNLPQLAAFCNTHEIKTLHLAYFGVEDPRSYGIAFVPITEHNIDESKANSRKNGWYAVSVNLVKGRPALFGSIPDGRGERLKVPDGAFRYFDSLTPACRIGHSILVYQIVSDVPATLDDGHRQR